MLVAAPVRARHRHQLERVRRNLAGVIKMRPAAQIFEGVVAVGADDDRPGRLVAVLVDAALRQAVDQLQLVGLIGENRARFIGADLAVLERILAGDDLPHPFLDLGQIPRRERAGLALCVGAEVEIVIEPGVDRRPDGDLRLRIDPQHGLRHHVRGGMAQPVQEFLRLFWIVFVGHVGLLGSG